MFLESLYLFLRQQPINRLISIEQVQKWMNFPHPLECNINNSIALIAIRSNGIFFLQTHFIWSHPETFLIQLHGV